MKKPAIPTAPKDPRRSRFDTSIKETLEIITGARGTRLEPLASNAGLSDVITKINELIDTMQ